MDDDAVRRWMERHTEAERILAGFDLCEVGLQQVLAQLRRTIPQPTVRDVLAYARRGGPP